MKTATPVLAALALVSQSDAFIANSSPNNSARCATELDATSSRRTCSRRNVLSSVSSGLLGVTLLSTAARPAHAKVEGYAPPSKSKALGEEYRQGTAALADMDEMAPVPREAYKKLPSGVTIADLRVGTGEEASVGKKVNVQWVLRKSNGYFVDSSEVSGGVPFIFTVGEKGGAIEGVDDGIRGMRVGGTRRLLIPVEKGYVEGLEDGKPGPLPVGFGPRQQMRRVQGLRKDVPGEYIFLEIQLTKVR
jgi:FKBP-type peptidyl-prolyl cis-trans isomerase